MEQLLSQTNVNEKNNLKSGEKPKQLIKRKEIDGTPFTIISQGKEHFLSIGIYRISEKTINKAELEHKVKERDWELLLSVITSVITMMEKNK